MLGQQTWLPIFSFPPSPPARTRTRRRRLHVSPRLWTAARLLPNGVGTTALSDGSPACPRPDEATARRAALARRGLAPCQFTYQRMARSSSRRRTGRCSCSSCARWSAPRWPMRTTCRAALTAAARPAAAARAAKPRGRCSITLQIFEFQI